MFTHSYTPTARLTITSFATDDVQHLINAFASEYLTL